MYSPPLFENLPMMISKMGSGLSKTVDPCIKKLYGTQEYDFFCAYNKIDSFYCFDGGDGDDFYFNSLLNKPTNELDTGKESCSDGYCSCPPMKEMVDWINLPPIVEIEPEVMKKHQFLSFDKAAEAF